MNDAEYQKLESILNLLTEVYTGKEEEFEAVLFVTQMVVEDLALSTTAIWSSLLYRAVLQNKISISKLARELSNPSLNIIEGLRKIEGIEIQNLKADEEKLSKEIDDKRKRLQLIKKIEEQTENYIKLLLTLVPDVRAILIKLVERVYLMRKMREWQAEDRMAIAEECQLIYAPIAHRLGLYRIKTELEELSMKYLNYETYSLIANKLSATKENRNQYIQSFIAPLKRYLKTAGYDCEIKGRPKSIASIWNKMQKQQVPFEGIYDLFAIRIILNDDFGNDRVKEKTACWNVYSIVTEAYTPNPKRLRDWISAPKSTGYESLHTTVIGSDGKWVEVQIRTRRMDEIAEKGHAAHWRYKETKTGQSGDNWLTKIRNLLEAPSVSALDKIDKDAKKELYSDEIYIFTPKGDLKKIKAGATILDFAFLIHTELGAKCIGAKVNGKSRHLKHILRNGDQVEIITSGNQKPSIGWLDILKTARAKSKVRRIIKGNRYSDAELGRDMLMYKLQQLNIGFMDNTINVLREYYNKKTTIELYQAYGTGELETGDIKQVFKEVEQKERTRQKNKAPKGLHDKKYEKTASAPESGKHEDYIIIDQNLKDVNFELAKCCKPIFGDDVFGFITVNRGISIHRTSCPNAPQMRERYPYRIVEARWRENAENKSASFLAGLRITGSDSLAIVTNISEVVSKTSNVQMRSINAESNDGLFEAKIMVYVNDNKDLGGLTKKLVGVKGVHKVERINF